MSDETDDQQPRKKHLRGIFYCSLAIILLIALAGYKPQQCPWISTEGLDRSALNPIGISGTYLSFAGLSIFGFGYILLPLFLLRAGAMHLLRRKAKMSRGRLYAMGCCLLASPIILAELQDLIPLLRHESIGSIFLNGLGGWYGTLLYQYLFLELLGRIGTALTLCILLFFAFWDIFTTHESLSEAIDLKLDRMGSIGTQLKKVGGLFKKIHPLRWIKRDRSPALLALANDYNVTPEIMINDVEITPLQGIQPEEEKVINDALRAFKRSPRPVEEESSTLPLPFDCYVFPPLTLLDEPPEPINSDETYDALSFELKETLRQFGVEVEIEGIQSGPVVTRFELVPAPGVRVEKIENLDKNIALTLKAPSVRILAPIPGESRVGIEIPKSKTDVVSLRSIIDSPVWREKNTEIPIVLGREVTGIPLIADLAKMPHLLIAGSTGSGKTACINSILSSFLYHASPEDLRLILVDPKIVEMQVYNRLPHMLLPTLTEPKKVPAALRWLIYEMERRYHIFASVGVRNIAGYNAKVLRTREELEKARELDRELSPEERAAMAKLGKVRQTQENLPDKKMPYIVCVIDELADLMIVAPADIENSVTRLAQLARAAGIHLILATQRPSVNVITGVIKANLPSRIAFKVASKVDSRTILDGNGADALLGRGDMLFLPPGSPSFIRAQGAWISDDEVNRLVDFIAKNGPPHFDQSAMEFLAQEEAEESTKQTRKN